MHSHTTVPTLTPHSYMLVCTSTHTDKIKIKSKQGWSVGTVLRSTGRRGGIPFAEYLQWATY